MNTHHLKRFLSIHSLIQHISEHLPYTRGRPWLLSGKESTCQCRRHGLGRSSGERNGKPFQYTCLGSPMDRGAWHIVQWVTKELDTKLIEAPNSKEPNLSKSRERYANIKAIIYSPLTT